MLKAHEAGFVDLWFSRNMADASRCLNQRDVTSEKQRVTLGGLSGAFLALGFGYASSENLYSGVDNRPHRKSADYTTQRGAYFHQCDEILRSDKQTRKTFSKLPRIFNLVSARRSRRVEIVTATSQRDYSSPLIGTLHPYTFPCLSAFHSHIFLMYTIELSTGVTGLISFIFRFMKSIFAKTGGLMRSLLAVAMSVAVLKTRSISPPEAGTPKSSLAIEAKQRESMGVYFPITQGTKAQVRRTIIVRRIWTT
ncbi:hypothetical protein OUZ56_025240 [Daphnia magna]|uniref:Uncharacterized protein n=1 Tax=Daphnia magna TaxID=35525 RepID=A0ABQ9ZJ92_9CRUS|nr:hypothetical protein OUZ56_025240 [Daphnia magna]